MPRNYNTALNFELLANARQFNSTLTKANARFTGFTNNIRSAGRLFAGGFLVSELVDVTKQIVSTRAEFQKFEAVLTNTLGSNSEAQRSLRLISEFAAETPFQVDEITDAFVKLANRGVKLTREEMASVGDVAAALGKPFAQLNEAILDVNNTKRWTELGIKVRTEGEKIVGTFKGIEIQAERTERGALDMIKQFSALEGVAGTTEAISKTIGGQLSNLTDNFTLLRNEIGRLIENESQGLISVFNSITKSATDTVRSFNNFDFIIGNAESANELAEAYARIDAKAESVRKTLDSLGPATAGSSANRLLLQSQLATYNEALDEIRQRQKSLQEESAKILAGPPSAKGEQNTIVRTVNTIREKIKELEKLKLTAPIEEAQKLTFEIKKLNEELAKFSDISRFTNKTPSAPIPRVESEGFSPLIGDPENIIPKNSINPLRQEFQALNQDIGLAGNTLLEFGDQLRVSLFQGEKAFDAFKEAGLAALNELIRALLRQVFIQGILNALTGGGAAGAQAVAGAVSGRGGFGTALNVTGTLVGSGSQLLGVIGNASYQQDRLG